MPRLLRRLLLLAAIIGAVAALRSYLFAVNERRYRDAFTPPTGTLPNVSANDGEGATTNPDCGPPA